MNHLSGGTWGQRPLAVILSSFKSSLLQVHNNLHFELHFATLPFSRVPEPLCGVRIDCYHQCVHLQPAETFNELKCPERGTYSRLET